MATWRKPDYLEASLPNRVFRFRKQAQSKYHKVIITDEANLTTLLPTCYKSVTLLFVDNMTKDQLKQEVNELLIHIHKRCKNQKVVFLYTCGLSTMFSRYSLANTSKGTNCCSNCDLYLYNSSHEDLFETMTSMRDLISTSMTICYFLPTALPPFSMKWHVTQFQAEHQKCCPHAMQVLSASDISKSVRDGMQTSFDKKLAQYNQLVNSDCKAKNLPIIDWSKTYLTNTNLNEREKNIMMKITSLLCDFISVIYQDECAQELQQIQNALSPSDDEVQVKEEPSDTQEESCLTLIEDISIKVESIEMNSKSPCTPRRSPRKLSDMKSPHQHTPEASNFHDPDNSNKRKLVTEENSKARNKKSRPSSALFQASFPITSCSEESTLEDGDGLFESIEIESLQQDSTIDEPENQRTSANKKQPSMACGEETADTQSNVTFNENVMNDAPAVPIKEVAKSTAESKQDDVNEITISSEVPSNNNTLTDVSPRCESLEVEVINPIGRRKPSSDLLSSSAKKKIESSSDIQILDNDIARSSSDIICLSKQSPKPNGRRGNGNTPKRFMCRNNDKSVASSNDDLIVLEQDTSSKKRAKQQPSLQQVNLQNLTQNFTNVDVTAIPTCTVDLDHSSNNSVCMDTSEENPTETTGDLIDCVEASSKVQVPNDSAKVNNEDDLGCIASTKKSQEQKIPTIINKKVQPTISLNNGALVNMNTVKKEPITEEATTMVEKNVSEANASGVARLPSVTELPITPKVEKDDSIEDVKPVLDEKGNFATPGYVAIQQCDIPKRDRRQRNSSISSTTSTEASSTQPEEFVESDVSVFKRTDAKGDSLHILITDERLDGLTDLLMSDMSYSNCMHICGHDTTIPQMNNSIREALAETRKLKMNKSKDLIVAVCLGTVDIINLLGSMKMLPPSRRKPKKVKYTTPEVVTLVYNRLVLLKRSILELDQNARVVLFKLPPTQVGGNVKNAIDQVNSLIHRCNRDDKSVSCGTRHPLRKLSKVSEPAFTLSKESAVHWLQTCKFVISLVEKGNSETKVAAAALKLKKTSAQKCLIDLEAPTTIGKKRSPSTDDEGKPGKVARIELELEPEIIEEGSEVQVAAIDGPEIVEEENGKNVSRTGSAENFKPDTLQEGNEMKVTEKGSSEKIETEVLVKSSMKNDSTKYGSIVFEQEVVDVEKDSSKKKSLGSDASGKRLKMKRRVTREVFINKHDNIVCITPGSVQSPRSSTRTSSITVTDEASPSSSTTPSVSSPQFLPEDDPINKQVNAYMRLLQLGDTDSHHNDTLSGASSQLSSNVCALLALLRVAVPSSTVDSEALTEAARCLQEHEQSDNNRGSPSLENSQKKAVIEAVGEAVQYLEDAVLGQAASDILYSAVLNVKKVYAA